VFAAGTSAGSLFDMVSIAMLKVQLLYAVRVLGTWKNRGGVEERSDTRMTDSNLVVDVYHFVSKILLF